MKKTKILIIDDEEDFTRMVKFNLEDQGAYEVRTVNIASNAVFAAENFKPDLVFIDVIMPGLEGPDVCSRFEQNDLIKGIPRVFLTATVTKEEVEKQKGVIGGRKFLAKAGTIQELIQCIEKNVHHRPVKRF